MCCTCREGCDTSKITPKHHFFKLSRGRTPSEPETNFVFQYKIFFVLSGFPLVPCSRRFPPSLLGLDPWRALESRNPFEGGQHHQHPIVDALNNNKQLFNEFSRVHGKGFKFSWQGASGWRTVCGSLRVPVFVLVGIAAKGHVRALSARSGPLSGECEAWNGACEV